MMRLRWQSVRRARIRILNRRANNYILTHPLAFTLAPITRCCRSCPS